MWHGFDQEVFSFYKVGHVACSYSYKKDSCDFCPKH